MLTRFLLSTCALLLFASPAWAGGVLAEAAIAPTILYAGTVGGASTCVLQSAVSTNSTNCKNAAGQLYGYDLVNTTSTIYYLRLYNSSSAPTCSSATGFVRTIPILATGGMSRDISVGETYGTAFTSGKATTLQVVGVGRFHAELWYLVNPTVTTANVVVSYSCANNTHAQAYAVVLLAGVSQSTPFDASSGTTGTSGTLSTVPITVADGAWIVDSAIGRDNAGLTVGAGQTSRSNRVIGTQLEGAGVSTVNGKTPPGSETMDWTQVSSTWVLSAVSLTPSTGGGAGTCKQTMLLMGVGC